MGIVNLPRFNIASSTASVSFGNRILTYTAFSFRDPLFPLEIALYSPSLHFLPNTRRPDVESRRRIFSNRAEEKEMKKAAEVANSAPDIARPEERRPEGSCCSLHIELHHQKTSHAFMTSHMHNMSSSYRARNWLFGSDYLGSQWKETSAYSLIVMVSFPATKELKFKCKIL